MLQYPETNPAIELPSEADTKSLFSSVLLIEDEAAHAKLLSRALRDLVGDITHVSNGNAALRALESQFFELVLSDLRLPDTTGVELLKSIRSARPDLPVIVMTTSNSIEDAISAMREGAWDYMVKEFTGDLGGRVQLVVGRTAARKLQQMRELHVRAERDAFWAAVHTAQDGLAMISGDGSVVFSNERFNEFCTLCLNGKLAGLPLNLVEIIRGMDESVAGGLSDQLQRASSNTLWTSEIKVASTAGEEKTERYFELTLSSVKPMGITEAEVGSVALGELRRSVVWLREITRRKEQEKFQRDLLSTTTHDLKGPLGAILTSAELLTEFTKTGDARAQDFITRIASCARNSIGLIDELLSARRIQDGVLVVRPHWQEATEPIDDIVLDYHPVAKAKGVALIYEKPGTPMDIYVDKLGFTRVLGNLIGNAIKFTPKGGRVEVSSERGNGEFRLTVSDTGTGIDAKSRHHLFEKYSRQDQHQQIEGTGLGLFVTKNIVDAHNGRIEVKSEMGAGTTFVVSFPDGAK